MKDTNLEQLIIEATNQVLLESSSSPETSQMLQSLVFTIVDIYTYRQSELTAVLCLSAVLRSSAYISDVSIAKSLDYLDVKIARMIKGSLVLAKKNESVVTPRYENVFKVQS